MIKNRYNLCLKMKKINPMVDIGGPFIFRLYPEFPIYNRLMANFSLDIPDNLKSWVEYLEKEDTYSKMPCTPEQFQERTKWMTFYSAYAFTSYSEVVRNPKKILHLSFGSSARLILKYFFFRYPYEYWMRIALGGFIERWNRYESKEI